MIALCQAVHIFTTAPPQVGAPGEGMVPNAAPWAFQNMNNEVVKSGRRDETASGTGQVLAAEHFQPTRILNAACMFSTRHSSRQTTSRGAFLGLRTRLYEDRQ